MKPLTFKSFVKAVDCEMIGSADDTVDNCETLGGPALVVPCEIV